MGEIVGKLGARGRERVITLLEVGDALLADNAEHVAACCHIEEES